MVTCKKDIDYIVKDIITYKLGLDGSQLVDATHLRDDLGVDSLDMVELYTELEKQFSIRITDEETERLDTIARIVHCVQGKMA